MQACFPHQCCKHNTTPLREPAHTSGAKTSWTMLIRSMCALCAIAPAGGAGNPVTAPSHNRFTASRRNVGRHKRIPAARDARSHVSWANLFTCTLPLALVPQPIALFFPSAQTHSHTNDDRRPQSQAQSSSAAVPMSRGAACLPDAGNATRGHGACSASLCPHLSLSFPSCHTPGGPHRFLESPKITES